MRAREWAGDQCRLGPVLPLNELWSGSSEVREVEITNSRKGTLVHGNLVLAQIRLLPLLAMELGAGGPYLEVLAGTNSVLATLSFLGRHVRGLELSF